MELSERLNEEENIQRLLQPPARWPFYDGYKPLDLKKREIRVLHIEFQSNGRDIRGRLEHVSLDDTPTFEAVSYYWGPPAQQKPIVLDGKTVFIRATLHSFMTVLCRKALRSTPLWLDALCINQRDDAERSQQVAMMSDIYRSAGGIKSWIGDGDYDTDYALAFLQHRHEATLTESVNFHEVQARAREALLHVTRFPYWNRLWVLQELALARTVTVYCGSQAVSWTDLISVVNESSQSTFDDPFLQDWDNKVSHITQELIWQPLIVLDDLRNTLRQTTPQHFNLLDQVFAFRHYGCVDKRDKMFGLLSLAALESHPVVDYTAAFVDVFSDMLCQSLSLFSKQYGLLDENLLAMSRSDTDGKNSVIPKRIPDSHSFTSGFQSRLTLKIRRLLQAFDIKEDSLEKSLQTVFNDRNQVFRWRRIGVVTARSSLRSARSRHWDPDSWLFESCGTHVPDSGDEIVSVLCHGHEIQIPKMIIRRGESGRFQIIGATWRFGSLRIDDQFPLIARSMTRGHVEIAAEDENRPDKLGLRCSRAFALAVFVNFMLDMSSQRPHLDIFLCPLRQAIPVGQLETDQSSEKPFRLLDASSTFRVSAEETGHGAEHDSNGEDHGNWTAFTHCLERFPEQRHQLVQSLQVEEGSEPESD